MPTDTASLRNSSYILWFDEISGSDVSRVGGKAASLGEMVGNLRKKDVLVPNGFSTTVDAYHDFMGQPLPEKAAAEFDLGEGATLADALRHLFEETDFEDDMQLHDTAERCRQLILSAPIPESIASEIDAGYEALCEEYGREIDTAVRSSATREDSAIASFAGQYESFLNVRGKTAVREGWRRCVASGFTERAIGYQLRHEMDPLEGAVAVVIMKMVRSDLATSGVIFTIDPDSGNPNVVVVSSSYGLGEMLVQGDVSPDVFTVWKEGLRRGTRALVHRRMGAKDRKLVYASQGGTRTESVDVEASLRRRWSLTEEEVNELARMALVVEEHYGRPMDIEWAKDGQSGQLMIVQARPETVHGGEPSRVLENYRFPEGTRDRLEGEGRVLASGVAVGMGVGTGKVRRYDTYEEVIVRKRRLRQLKKEGTDLSALPPEEHVFDPGDVLVTEMTTPDWEPLMKEASLIVTERGGRTSHAAIVAREFGIPAIVGVGGARELLEPLQTVTGSCAEGEVGWIYDGAVPYEVERVELESLPETRTRVKLNVGFPDKALKDATLPSDGVGLARIEFILTAQVGIHPLALAWFRELRVFAETGRVPEPLAPWADRLVAIRNEDPDDFDALLGAIERRTPGYASQRQFFVDQLKYGIGLICAAFYPRPVLVRLSDLKSNEYRELLGGRIFEPLEENPMIAWRGASRYVDSTFEEAFRMECEALRYVNREMGLDNLQVMVPFCRSPEEGRDVVETLEREGLDPDHGVPLFLMVELPSNVVEAGRFIDEMGLDGGSIGSNDLVQTTYAVSRDDLEHYSHPVDARSPAVQIMIRQAIEAFRAAGKEIGICGQAPSDFPEVIPSFLVDCGIDSISVTPDTALRVRIAIAEAEARLAESS